MPGFLVILLASISWAGDWQGFQFPSATTGAGPVGLATGDFNGDGITDFVTANYLTDNISVIPGNGIWGSGNGTFGPHSLLIAGSDPQHVATGDFNSDGITDLVAANMSSDDVSVYLGGGSAGAGDGTFGSQVTFQVGGEPVSVSTGDFNGDGITDLVTANRLSNNISVLLGNGNEGIGDGTFALQLTFAVGTDPNSVILGDFNGDQVVDIATSNAGSNDVSVLIGTGDGNFESATSFAVGESAVNLTSGDFNRDGITDLATANQESNDISVLLGNGNDGKGDGTFAPQSLYSAGEEPSGIVIGDFNSDDNIDIATANVGSDNISVFLGLGEGNYTTGVNYFVGCCPDSIVAGDFNSDGITDLATSSGESRSVSIHLGNANAGIGDGTFKPQNPFSVGDLPQSFAVADFNEDGYDDIVTANTFSNDISVLLSKGEDGNFFPKVDYDVGSGPRGVTTGDFNGDSITDIVTVNPSSNDLSLFFGKGSSGIGDGTFESPVSYSLGGSSVYVTTGDFNSDGISDLVVANLSSDSVSVLIGNGTAGIGDGTFANPVSYTTGSSPISISTGDFNDDDITDLAVANLTSNSVSVLLGNGTAGSGDGTFAAPGFYATGETPRSVATGDFNDDGITDLATANQGSSDVSVLLGRGLAGSGDGTFGDEVKYGAGDVPNSITAVDLNSDGILDLATANIASGDISVLLGNKSGRNGDGTFATPVNYPAGTGSASISSGDFDGDGIIDLVAANRSSDNVSVLIGVAKRGIGDGTFITQDFFTTDIDPNNITSGDFNEDGITDLATTNGDADSVSILLGNGTDGIGDGTFASSLIFDTGETPTAIITGDFNGDTITDLVTANRSSNNVSVLLGNDNGDGSESVGDGTFGGPAMFPTGNTPTALTSDDFNGDGIKDLAVTNNGSGSISILLGNGTEGQGDATFAMAINYSVGEAPSSIATADLNGDLISDIVTTNILSNDLSILFGNGSNGIGDGTFSSGGSLDSPGRPRSVMTGDFNGDGITDLAVTNQLSGSVSVLIGNGTGNVGDGTFSDPENYFAEMFPAGLTVADFNKDGITDLAASAIFSENVWVLLGSGRFGSGDGAFKSYAAFSTGYPPLAVITGDFNSDGFPDLATANPESDNVSVNLNLGFSSQAPETFPTTWILTGPVR